MNEKIIIIAGPTASGKTALAVELAKKINGEIINADSRSIYKELDIGTSKPTKEEMGGIPHHLFDIVEPNEKFSAVEFKRLAREKIEEIWSKNKTPIIVGGTGLYIDALVYDYSFSEGNENSESRERLGKLSLDQLQEEITKNGIEIKNESEFKNKRRLTRTLEIFYQTGKGKSEEKKSLPKNVIYFALDVPRQELYRKIDKRIDLWMGGSFEKEVKNLINRYSLNDPGMNGIGYKEIALYLTGKISRDSGILKFKQLSRNLAKRQLTWFKRNKDIVWIKNDDLEKILNIIKK